MWALLIGQVGFSEYLTPKRNRNLQISRTPLKNQAQGTSLFRIVATNQRNCPREVQGKLRSHFQRDRGDRVAVKASVV